MVIKYNKWLFPCYTHVFTDWIILCFTGAHATIPQNCAQFVCRWLAAVYNVWRHVVDCDTLLWRCISGISDAAAEKKHQNTKRTTVERKENNWCKASNNTQNISVQKKTEIMTFRKTKQVSLLMCFIRISTDLQIWKNEHELKS